MPEVFGREDERVNQMIRAVHVTRARAQERERERDVQRERERERETERERERERTVIVSLLSFTYFMAYNLR